MPRAPRHLTVFPGLPHHVWLRGNNRRVIFSYEGERRRFFGYLLEALARDRIKLHAASLLSNHVHLLLTPPEVACLSRAMKSVMQRYALWRNRARDGSGGLFEERFGARAVGQPAYLAHVTAYIDLNPEFACASAATRRWSTVGLHAGAPDGCAIPVIAWDPTDWYLSLGSDPHERAARYREWLDVVRAARTAAAVEEAPAMRSGRRVERPNRTSAR